MIKINFEKQIQWKQICFVLIAIIAAYVIYDIKDYRYNRVQEQANNIAITLSQVAKINGMPINHIKSINIVLERNGFAKYITIINQDTTKKEQK